MPIPAAPPELLAERPAHALFEPLQGYDDVFRYWAHVDYVLGWVRQAPANLPLVTSGDAKNKVPGAIGQAGTTVLFGNAGIGFRAASGLHLTLGAWVDAHNILGLEAGTYGMERRANDFAVSSSAVGSPLMAVPFVDRTGPVSVESAHLISNPQKMTGDILIASSLQRFGAEFSGIYCFWRRPGLELSVLAGIRYEDLQESMRILQHSIPIAAKTNTTFDDQFDTRNQFLGGQIAFRLHCQREVWVFDFTPKIAIGNTHQLVDIQGDSSQFGAKASPAGVFAGGFFAQPSNIGKTMGDVVVAIPALELKVAYQFTPCLRVFAAYEIMYWNQVVRPGDQIDRNINLSQSALLGMTRGMLSGPALPAPPFHRTGFWIQDMNFGIELRY